MPIFQKFILDQPMGKLDECYFNKIIERLMILISFKTTTQSEFIFVLQKNSQYQNG